MFSAVFPIFCSFPLYQISGLHFHEKLGIKIAVFLCVVEENFFWFWILLLSPSLASSTDNRQYRAVMASGANTLRIEYKVFMAVLFVSFIVVCNIITSIPTNFKRHGFVVPLYRILSVL